MSERAQDVSNKIELSKVEEIKEKPLKFVFSLVQQQQLKTIIFFSSKQIISQFVRNYFCICDSQQLEEKKAGKKGEIYKLKADSADEAAHWVKTLRKEIAKA